MTTIIRTGYGNVIINGRRLFIGPNTWDNLNIKARNNVEVSNEHLGGATTLSYVSGDNEDMIYRVGGTDKLTMFCSEEVGKLFGTIPKTIWYRQLSPTKRKVK